jgi:hypothetical protein
MSLRSAILILGGWCLLAFTSGCAGGIPEARGCPRVPPAAYFGEVSKPVPPRRGQAEFLEYVYELSLSWDLLYGDRLRAGEYLKESE